MKTAATLRILTGSIVLLLAPSATHALTDTWDGGGASDAIGIGANWADNTAPFSDVLNTDLIFAGVVRLTPDFTSAFSVRSVSFNNTAGIFIIGGSNLTVGTGGIVNNDTDTQTFGNAITVGAASVSFNAASGPLTFTNVVSVGSNTLSLDGAGAFSFLNFSGLGSVVKNGTGVMSYAPTANQQIDLAINAGTVNTVADGSTDSFDANASIAVNGTSIFNINGRLTLDGAQLTRASGAGLAVAPGKTLTIQNGGDAIITGAFINSTASTIEIFGTGSTFSTTSTLSLNGGSTTNISAGGSLSTGIFPVNIGTNSGNGTVTVDGSGSSLRAGSLGLGSSGGAGSLTFSNDSTGAFTSLLVDNSLTTGSSGTLTIQSGAAVTGTLLSIATNPAANTGTVTINPGSSLTLTGAATASIGATSASTGTLDVQNGGVFNSGTGTTTINTTGFVRFLGGTFNANGNVVLSGLLTSGTDGVFNLAAGKTLTIQNGGDAVFKRTFSTGTTTTNGGNFTVTGAGSSLRTSELDLSHGSVISVLLGGSIFSAFGGFNIGTNGNGTLIVDGGFSSADVSSSVGPTVVNSWGAGGHSAAVTISNGATGRLVGVAIGSDNTSGSSAVAQVLSGADVTSESVSVGSGSGVNTGSLTVDGASSTWAIAGAEPLFVGSLSSTGTLTVSNGGTFTTGASSTTTVNARGSIAINGGTFNSNGALIVDGGGQLTRDGVGALNLASGTTVTVQNGGDVVLTGPFNNNTATTIEITGAGSTFSTTSTLSLNGGSTTNVSAGGSLSAGISSVNIGISSGNGTVTVDGSGSSLSAGVLVLGASGNAGSLTFGNGSTGAFTSLFVDSVSTPGSGALAIQSGAAVTGTRLAIATNTIASNGTVTIDGVGSSLTLTGAAAAGIGATSASTGTLNVQNGGAFNSGTGTTTVDATGTVAITGGTFNANGNMTVNGLLTCDATGVFNLAAGKALTIQNGGDANFIGSYATGTTPTDGGNITVTGAGSTLRASSFDLSHGSAVSVLQGGSIVSSSGVLGIGTNGNGTLTVDGSGSSASAIFTLCGFGGHSADVTFSNNATGSFSFLNIGAAFTSGSSAVVRVLSGADLTSGSVSLGSGIGVNTGSLTVDGAGSTWTIGGAGSLSVGSATSTATLTVSDGGTFTSGAGSTSVGALGSIAINGGTFNFNSNSFLGRLIVDGGQLTRDSAGTLNLGIGTTLTVKNGGDAVLTGPFSQLTRSNLTVTGTGSTFATSGDFQWEGGNSILAFLQVANSGLLSSAGALHLGRNNTAVSLSVSGAGSQISAGTSSTSEWQAGVLLTNGATANLGGLRIADVVFGSNSSGSLDVQSGATASMGNIAAGSAITAATAAISVDGIGSQVTQTGASTLTLGAAFSSSASLSVSNSGAFTSGTGAFTFNATGLLNLDGGTATFNGPLTNNGGTVSFSSGALLFTNPDVNLTIGSGGLLGTSLTLTSAQRLAIAGTTTIDAFRTLTLNGGALSTGALVNNGALVFNSGTLGITGAGGFTIGTGALGSSVKLGAGANLQVSNTTTVASGALLRVDGGSFSGSDVTNDGTIDHRDGAFDFTGTLTNNSAGRIFVGGLASPAGAISNAGRITMENSIGFLGGTGAFTNMGLITGDGTIAKPVTNSANGQIRAEAGRTLTFTGAFAPNAGTLSLAGGTLEWTGPVTNAISGFISGRGTLHTGGLTNNGAMAFSSGNADIHGDVNNATGARIVTSGAGATTTFYDDVVHNGREIFTGAGGSTVFFGDQSGAGPFTGSGTVYNIGDLRPGNSPATVSYGGDLVLGSTASLTLEIGGLRAGTEYDSLKVAGTLFADGALILSLIDGFVPQEGDRFQLFEVGKFAGDFDAIQTPTLPDGESWDTSALKTAGLVSIVPEPGGAALLLGGLALIGLRRRR